MKKLNNQIQILRGLAIIAVVIIHTIPRGEWQVICRPFVNFAVAIFIFLSGYLTHDINNDDWGTICKKRIYRVLLPYIIWSIVYGFPLIFEGQLLKFGFRLITATTCYPFYYIFVYIQFVLMTPLILKLIKSRYQGLGWIISPIFIIVSIYIPRFTHIQVNEYISIINVDLCLGWFGFYYLGLILGNNLLKDGEDPIRYLSGRMLSSYNHKTNNPISTIALLIIYLSSLLLQMLEIYAWNKAGIINCGTQLNLTAILSSMLFCFISYRIINENIHIYGSHLLIILGNYSFGIYMSHVLIIKILANVQIYHLIPYLIKSIIILIISFILCYILSRILGNRIGRYVGLE